MYDHSSADFQMYYNYYYYYYMYMILLQGCCRCSCEVPYHATFVTDRSSREFQVQPQSGLLPARGCGPGALITVGFTPHIYGRTCIARLIIQVNSFVVVLLIHISALVAASEVVVKGVCIVFNGNPSRSHGASPAMWDHSVLSATQHS